MSMVWDNRNYLNWKANILNELQIFQRKHAQTKPVASILSQSCIYSMPNATIPTEKRMV